MASVTSLHLQYRLWIAEMNADINVLRIFDDYLVEIIAKDNNAGTVTHVNNYKKLFNKLRKNMDELRHEMHLSKMKMAEFLKTDVATIKDVKHAINHKEIKQRYCVFRKLFDKTKRRFKDLKFSSK